MSLSSRQPSPAIGTCSYHVSPMEEASWVVHGEAKRSFPFFGGFSVDICTKIKGIERLGCPKRRPSSISKSIHCQTATRKALLTKRLYHYSPSQDMPSLSSLFSGHSKPEPPPCLTFHGPDSNEQFFALGPNGQQLAHFSVTKKAIARIWAPHIPPQEFCTFHRSSLSGTTTLQLHGQEIKVRQSWEGLSYGRDVKTAAGTMKWRPGSSGTEEFRDAQGILLARGKLPGTLTKKVYPLEVFVPGDEFLLDLILACWVAILNCQKAEGKDAEAAGDIVSSLIGG